MLVTTLKARVRKTKPITRLSARFVCAMVSRCFGVSSRRLSNSVNRQSWCGAKNCTSTPHKSTRTPIWTPLPLVLRSRHEKRFGSISKPFLRQNQHRLSRPKKATEMRHFPNLFHRMHPTRPPRCCPSCSQRHDVRNLRWRTRPDTTGSPRKGGSSARSMGPINGR